MESLAYGALGAVHRPAHSASVRTHPRRQTAQGWVTVRILGSFAWPGSIRRFERKLLPNERS